MNVIKSKRFFFDARVMSDDTKVNWYISNFYICLLMAIIGY